MLKEMEQLQQTVAWAQEELDFPDFLAAQIEAMAASGADYSPLRQRLEELRSLVADYHTYAEACCEKLGTSANEVKAFIAWLRLQAEG